MNDRYKLNLFLTPSEEYYQNIDITPELYTKEYLRLCLDSKFYKKKDNTKSWSDILPNLIGVKRLWLVYPTNQEFFEVVCKMPSLQRLSLDSLKIHNLNCITKLQNLNYLNIDSCQRIESIKPILQLKNLEYLWIENCFNIRDLELIGEMTQLKALCLQGHAFAPKNLKIQSLKPFRNLKNLKHLDISSSSVIDKSYEVILELENLERFDLTSSIKPAVAEEIKSKHKTLKAGFFVDYDYKNKEFYPDKDWAIINSH